MHLPAALAARIVERKLRDARGRLLGGDLDALHHAWNHFVLNAHVLALGVLAHYGEINSGIVRRNAGQMLDGSKIGEEFKLLTQRDVDAGKAAADRSGNRSFECDARPLDGLVNFFGNVFLELLVGVGAYGAALPRELHAGRFEDADDGRCDLGSNTVAGNECYFMDHSDLVLHAGFVLLLRFGIAVHQLLEFRVKFSHVLEIAIDRSKTDERDRIMLLQALHDLFANLSRGALAIRRVDDKRLDFVHQLLELAHRDRTLLACAQQSREDLLPVKLFAPAVFLHDHVRNLVDALVGGEAPLTFHALATAAN